MRDLKSVDVTEEWIHNRKLALDENRRALFCKLRGYPLNKLIDVLPDLGWDAELHKWVIPIRNMDGEHYFAKAWTNDPGTKPDGTLREKWATIGGAKASAHGRQGKPTGQVFDLAWVIDKLSHEDAIQLPWLWMTAGEFDCLMLRCQGWLATCTTTGESSSLSVEFFIREFGGLAAASILLANLSGIVLVYDCDPAGVRGMQRHAALLDQFFDQINQASLDDKSGVHALPSTFIGVKAVDLRQHPQWELLNKPVGWDISDLARWSREVNGQASKWLKEQVNENAAGVGAISGYLGLEWDAEAGSPTIGEILGEQFKTMTFEELMRSGVGYARLKGSRNEGWYHMAVVAARNGWTMEELWYQDTDDPSDGLGPMKLLERLRRVSKLNWPDKKDMPEEEVRRCFERAFLDYKQQAFIMDDTANMLRLFHYFRWLRYHHTRGWLWFDNGAWIPGDGHAFEKATQIGGLINEEANNLAATDGPPKLIVGLRRWAKLSRSSGKVSSMLSMAAKHPLGRPDHEAEAGGWDLNPWHIGTNRGVFDLRNGVLLGRFESLNAYCSMSTPGTIDDRGWDVCLGLPAGVDDDLGVRCRLWDRVVRSWFDDQASLDMLQEIGGTCLLGRLIQKLFVFESSGRSGKSLCLTAWSSALGAYAGVMLGSVMGSRSTDNAKSSAMAGLDALRMVRIDEMGSVAIDVEMLKSITGETTMAARALRENWTQVRNMGTFVGTANGTLNLSRDVTEALRSRIVYVKWPMTFVDANLIGRVDYANDPHVKAENPSLGWELSQPSMSTPILTWMYAGLRRMLERDGDGVQVRVTEATMSAIDALWNENNLIKQFFEESGLWRHVSAGEKGTVVATNGLRQKMAEWARVVGDNDFAAALDRDNRVLGKMLSKMRMAGFAPINNATTALWMTPGLRQVRAWNVPYVFEGK